MAIKNVVIPWLSGGVVLLGYAAFAWLQKRPRSTPRAEGTLPHAEYDVAPLSDRLKRVPEDLALDAELEPVSPANSNGAARHAQLGALFLGRASSAFSKFQNATEPSSPASNNTGKF